MSTNRPIINRNSPLQKLPSELKNSDFLQTLIQSGSPGGHRSKEIGRIEHITPESESHDPYSLVPIKTEVIANIDYSFLTDPKYRRVILQKMKQEKYGKSITKYPNSKNIYIHSPKNIYIQSPKTHKSMPHSPSGIGIKGRDGEVSEELLHSLNLSKESNIQEMGEREFKALKRVVRKHLHRFEPQNCAASGSPLLLENLCASGKFSKYRKRLTQVQDRLQREEIDELGDLQPNFMFSPRGAIGPEIQENAREGENTNNNNNNNITEEKISLEPERENKTEIFGLTELSRENKRNPELGVISESYSSSMQNSYFSTPHKSSIDKFKFTENINLENKSKPSKISSISSTKSFKLEDNIITNININKRRLHGLQHRRNNQNQGKNPNPKRLSQQSISKLPGSYLFKALEERGLSSSEESEKGEKNSPPNLFEKGGGFDRIQTQINDYQRKIKEIRQIRENRKLLLQNNNIIDRNKELKESELENKLEKELENELPGVSNFSIQRLIMEGRREVEEFRRKQNRFLKRMRGKSRFAQGEALSLSPKTNIDNILAIRRNSRYLSPLESSTSTTQTPALSANLKLFPETTKLLMNNIFMGRRSPRSSRSPSTRISGSTRLLAAGDINLNEKPLNLDYSLSNLNTQNLNTKNLNTKNLNTQNYSHNTQNTTNEINGSRISERSDSEKSSSSREKKTDVVTQTQTQIQGISKVKARKLIRLFLEDVQTTREQTCHLPLMGHEFDDMRDQLENIPLNKTIHY